MREAGWCPCRRRRHAVAARGLFNRCCLYATKVMACRQARRARNEMMPSPCLRWEGAFIASTCCSRCVAASLLLLSRAMPSPLGVLPPYVAAAPSAVCCAPCRHAATSAGFVAGVCCHTAPHVVATPCYAARRARYARGDKKIGVFDTPPPWCAAVVSRRARASVYQNAATFAPQNTLRCCLRRRFAAA